MVSGLRTEWISNEMEQCAFSRNIDYPGHSFGYLLIKDQPQILANAYTCCWHKPDDNEELSHIIKTPIFSKKTQFVYNQNIINKSLSALKVTFIIESVEKGKFVWDSSDIVYGPSTKLIMALYDYLLNKYVITLPKKNALFLWDKYREQYSYETNKVVERHIDELIGLGDIFAVVKKDIENRKNMLPKLKNWDVQMVLIICYMVLPVQVNLHLCVQSPWSLTRQCLLQT